MEIFVPRGAFSFGKRFWKTEKGFVNNSPKHLVNTVCVLIVLAPPVLIRL